PSNNTSEFSEVAADVGLTKSASAGSVAIGQTLTYSLAVSNAGPFPSLPVVSDTLPSGVTFLSATGGVTPTNGVVTFTLPALPVGASTTVSFTVQAPSFPGTLVNSASVTSIVHDPNTANNSASASTTV